MKPAKGLYPFAAWLIRLTMLLFAYVFYYKIIAGFDFSDINFYIAAAFALFTILLFVGGFLTKPAMTVISAFFLFGLSVYEFIQNFSQDPDAPMVIYMLVASVMLMMFSVGNKK